VAGAALAGRAEQHAAESAFGRGDAEGAMENISDSIERVVAGDNAVSGTYRGKEQVGEFWAQIAEKGFQTKPVEGEKMLDRVFPK
jgi:hypothetical protein